MPTSKDLYVYEAERCLSYQFYIVKVRIYVDLSCLLGSVMAPFFRFLLLYDGHVGKATNLCIEIILQI